jgi:hypothetical protein
VVLDLPTQKYLHQLCQKRLMCFAVCEADSGKSAYSLCYDVLRDAMKEKACNAAGLQYS